MKKKRFPGICMALFMFCASSCVSGAEEILSARDSFDAAEQPEMALLPAVTLREIVLVEGEKFIDVPYRSPPRAPENFDCSSFVSFLFRTYTDMNVPSSSADFAAMGESIDFEDARPGDLLIFTSSPGGTRINHIAFLYQKSETGELRGSLLLHAVSSPARVSTVRGNPATTGVKITELGRRGDGNWEREYFLRRFSGVRRIFGE